jgi:hypothetical protein
MCCYFVGILKFGYMAPKWNLIRKCRVHQEACSSASAQLDSHCLSGWNLTLTF